MKKLLFILFMFATMVTSAQMYQITVQVSGHITDEQTGAPVVNHEVYISLFNQSDSTSGITTVLLTGPLGNYDFTGTIEGEQGTLQISTSNCDGSTQGEIVPVSANAQNVFVFDFVVSCQPGGCQAAFSYYAVDYQTIQFMDESIGSNLSYMWSFGDGTYSNEAYPLKYYQQTGVYEVMLVVSSSDSVCTSVASNLVMVGDSIVENCLASFIYACSPNSYEISFFDTSIGNPTMWTWIFEDGTVSNEQNPVHTFYQPGEYAVSLTIQNADSSCISSVTQMVYVGSTGNCMASFYFQPNPNSYEISFFDTSIGNPTMWTWHFGDDTFSNEQNPIHTYTYAGEFVVSLTIQNADSSCYSTFTQLVSVGGSTGCFAWFQPEFDPTNGNNVTFHDMSMGNIENWFWDFGDGTNSTEASPVHTYAETGIYSVCLTISSSDSLCYDVACQTITVGEATTCLAQFTYYPDSTDNQTGIQFVDLSYGNLISWSWSFGDGTGSTEQNPVHVFSTDGVYNVCLTVTSENCQSSWCEQVTVGETDPGCFNYFTYVNAGNSVQFEGFHSSDIPASYQWDFGDGIAALGNPFTHTYPNPGVYFVTLTTWDDNQCTATSGQSIVVGDSMAFNQVYGQVFEGNWPMNTGFVMIFSMESDTNYFPYFNLAPVDSMGVYAFPFVPNGSFNLFAIPLDGNGYLPTYYESTLFWEEATQVIPGETENPYNISLVSASAPLYPGNGTISGQINQSGVRADFIGQIIVFLMNADHQPLGFTEVASDGSFQFTGLAYGTYFIKPELAGVNSDYMRVDITEGQNVITLNMTFSGNSFLGSMENETTSVVGSFYPNPVNEIAHIEISLDKQNSYTVLIYDLSGRMISETKYEIPAGKSTIELPVSELESGVYFVKMIMSNGTSLSRKIIKE